MSWGPAGNEDMKDIGILLHGRHVQAIDWETMLWGEPDKNKLGSAPKAILCMLDVGPENIRLLTIGTGASKKTDGTIEAAAIQQLLVHRLTELDAFESIKQHPHWRASQQLLQTIVAEAVLDTSSQNTFEEIVNAATLFANNNIRNVLEVTGASHGPRCQVLQGDARARGIIPPAQHWYLATDDMPYPNTTVTDTTVIEMPHRGDDPARDFPNNLQAAKVFKEFFGVPAEAKLSLLQQIATDIEKAKANN